MLETAWHVMDTGLLAAIFFRMGFHASELKNHAAMLRALWSKVFFNSNPEHKEITS